MERIAIRSGLLATMLLVSTWGSVGFSQPCPGDPACDAGAEWPPTDAEIEEIARRQAATLERGQLFLYESMDFLGRGSVPRTRLFVLTPNDQLPGRAALIAALSDPRTGAALAEQLICVEVGLLQDVPPVVGYWRGPPWEYLADPEARAAVMREQGVSRLRLANRYAYGIAPVLEFDTERGPMFYSPLVSRSTSRFDVAPRDENDPNVVARRDRFAAAWRRQLTAVRDD